MNKLSLPSLVLATFCACAPHVYSQTSRYTITVDFNPYDVAKLVKVNEYCMVSYLTPNVVTIVQGKASFIVESQGDIFRKCGYVHSSATYDVQDSTGMSVGSLEFYKPYAKNPYLDFDSATLKCNSSSLEDCKLTLTCDNAAKICDSGLPQ